MNSNNTGVDVKIVAIHQPNPFPRLKVIQKITRSNVWVVYDNVQFVRREWQNRALFRYLKQPDNLFWVNVPIEKTVYAETNINLIKISNYKSFFSELYKQLLHAYKSSKHWHYIDAYLEKLSPEYMPDDVSLSYFSVKTVVEIYQLLNIKKEIVFSSDLSLYGDRNFKLINLCKQVGGHLYISGSGGKTYLNEKIFNDNNVKVIWQDWDEASFHKDYDGLSWRNVAFLDFFARYGLDELKKILYL